MTCPACHSEVPTSSRYCPTCGQRLADTNAKIGVAPATIAAGRAETASASTGLTQAFAATRTANTIGPVHTPVRQPFAIGDVVANRYCIESLLGQGGMGVVYLAADRRLAHQVALKCLPPAFATEDGRLTQFHREVRLARQISHRNVCRVHDIGEVNGQLFLSMEYIDGQDLATRLVTGGGLLEAEAVELLRGVCAGLAAVHAQGVLHRDLKPANIMVNRSGQPLLTDFGIAGAAVDFRDADRTMEGTLAYMAPELLGAGEPSVRSDIYALGHVMYETFTGRRLCTAKTVDGLRREHEDAAAAAAAELASLVSPRLVAAVRQCLDPDPARRPASVNDVIAMLQTVLLDARVTPSRRLLQIGEQTLVVVPIIVAIVAQRGLAMWAAAVAAVAVVALIERRFPLGWTVHYKGHAIHAQNHALLMERLYIDGRLVDRGRFRKRVTLRGTIEAGVGAGERITARMDAGLTRFACRIVAETFGADG